MADAKRVLVTGATGQQGGAVVDALLKDGNTVRALTRNPQSDKAAALKSRGVEIVSGDFGDRSSLEAAIRGVDAAFLLSTSFEAGTEAETAQGIAFVEAAAAVNLPYLVYTSVGDANRATGIPHFDSKYRVEERIKELGIDHAIIAPAYFYENMMAPFVLPGLRNGVFARSEIDLADLHADFIVSETDGMVHGCGALHRYGDDQAEIAGLAVDPQYDHLGIGQRMVSYLIDRAREEGISRVFALTTQVSDWFENLGFVSGTVADVPDRKQSAYDHSRKSRILVFDL